jgi:molybdopterin-guanine dinucleotide biosynthesis protein MobB
MQDRAQAPLLGFAAFSGTGKTTLLTALIPLLTARGLRIGVIKHAHHSFDVDQPGKDSYVLRQSGAAKVMVASGRRWALMTETPQQIEVRLHTLLPELNQDDLDLVLVEGFKSESFPKIELHRPALGHPLLFPDDENIVAIASDTPVAANTAGRVVLDLNNVDGIADFVYNYVRTGSVADPSAPPDDGSENTAVSE